ncbi:hypothetical protein BCR39DRAFT_546522 [Naematelia encephala]|uniref:N-terminal of MaoC-like dehydratase domain-containing protein n=1 Tax=Naematelia encephala TaxID=71784 RepID=A0A1Y2APR2_9TREE|nr:hypothetical protein BCR39DRAFT_546522 [Naematelia encephala]
MLYSSFSTPAKRLGLSACRVYSDSTRPPPSIQAWIRDLTSRKPILSTDVIDRARAAQLQRTLPTRQSVSAISVNQGDHLPKGHHLIYFQPETMQKDLAEDGSSPEFNAPKPFLRRMWAGGSIRWSDKPLTVGSTVTQSVTVPRAEFKAGMIFVHQQRDILAGAANKDDWAVREIRTHVFREDVKEKNEQVKLKAQRASEVLINNPSTFSFLPTPPLLFRYSALTFNGHRIHYDRDWTRLVEGHPDLVFHGPLTATLLIDLADKAGKSTHRALAHFDYRATSPMYTDRSINLISGWKDNSGDGETVLEMIAEQEGRVGMTATARFRPS